MLALLEAILAMVGSRLLAPVAVLVIMYFVNDRRLGEHRAGTGRNLTPGITTLFALALVGHGVVGFLR